MNNPDYPHMELLAKLSGLVDDCAQAWQAVGQSEMSALGDPSLPYRKKEALEASKALKDAIYDAIPISNADQLSGNSHG